MAVSTSKSLILWICIIALIAQIPSGLLFYRVSEMQKAISHYNEILASSAADNADIEFIAQLKKEAGFNHDIQILIGPYRRLYGDSFKYRLEKHLAFVEQSQTTKETFLILIDKTFYSELDKEHRKGILAHEMWHIFSLSKGFIKPRTNEELDADNYAVRYVSADIIMDLCKRYEGDEWMKKLRTENLKRQKLTPIPTGIS